MGHCWSWRTGYAPLSPPFDPAKRAARGRRASFNASGGGIDHRRPRKRFSPFPALCSVHRLEACGQTTHLFSGAAALSCLVLPVACGAAPIYP